jgi:sugar phosphate isomerase/epimerase
VAYVKDVTADRRWVPLGQGQVGGSGFFEQLRKMNYRAPISLHIEYNWGGNTREGLLPVLEQNANTLKRWLAEA